MQHGTVRIGGHDIELSHLDKLPFPDNGVTKAGLIAHYRRVADVALPRYRGRPDHPDRLVFDLDPRGDDFEAVRRAARHLHRLLHGLKLVSYAQTTGSRGLHVVVPPDHSADFDAARKFARGVAEWLAQRHPDELTIEQRKARRGDRVFLDYVRNAFGQTAVAPYAVRAREGAPVATPLDWHEVGARHLHARRYTLRNIGRRLGQKADPWRDIGRHGQSVGAGAKRSADIASRHRDRSG